MKVSIIIPTYNRAKFIGGAIQSVLGQTYQDFEVIIIDDGSTDNTKEAVRRFKDSRISYLVQKENRGTSMVKNIGIREAKGKYIAFLDDDDKWLPEKLEMQVSKLEKSSTDTGFIYCGYKMLNKEGKILRKIQPKFKGEIYQNLLRRNFIALPTILVKKEIFQKTELFDEELKFGEDWDLFLRMAKLYKSDFVNDYLVDCYIYGKRLTTESLKDSSIRIYSLNKIIKKNIEEYRERPQIYSCILSSLGNIYCQGGKLSRGRNCFKESIKISPFNIKSYIYLILSLFGSGIYCKVFKIGLGLDNKMFINRSY